MPDHTHNLSSMNTFMECAFPQILSLNTWQPMSMYITAVRVVHKICHTELLGTVAFCLPTAPMYPESGDHRDMEE